MKTNGFDDFEKFDKIENAFDAMKQFGFHYGWDAYIITEDDLQALRDGKLLASVVNGGEYSIFIKLQ